MTGGVAWICLRFVTEKLAVSRKYGNEHSKSKKVEMNLLII
jgi:hypothetical protein